MWSASFIVGIQKRNRIDPSNLICTPFSFLIRAKLAARFCRLAIIRFNHIDPALDRWTVSFLQSEIRPPKTIQVKAVLVLLEYNHGYLTTLTKHSLL